MKYNKKLSLFGIGFACLFSACDLDKFPEGDITTQDQKEDVTSKDPSMLSADLNAIYGNFITYGTVRTSTNEYHYDFGYPAVCMFYDASGQDIVAPNSGYNWFGDGLVFSDRSYTTVPNRFLWRYFYNQIKSANDLLKLIDPESEEKEMDYFAGQAYAARAFDYFHLVQMYQFNYVDHKNDPAVPIVTDDQTFEEQLNNPRATVQQVYDLILSDLDKAIELLEGYSRPNNGFINQQVAYGIRARVNLTMQNWAAAAADAAEARNGFTPYSIADVSRPSFNSADNKSWMWAAIITENNDVVQTGIVNWPSHLCSFVSNGYTTATETYRLINDNLWNQIPTTDVRKGWWVDEDLQSPLLAEYGADLGEDYGYSPYTNVKFGPYNNDLSESNNASDWPLMRVEEMYLIEAEALAMSNRTSDAITLLQEFVRNYRDPEYSITVSSAADIQNEVWFQRRIELWGEGFSLFDILRLKKPIQRKGTNFPADVQYSIPAEDPILIYQITSEEINANNGISESDNNPAVPAPSV